MLIPEFRRALEKAVREREPIHKRENRESADFWLKVVVSIFTVLIGIVGAVTGLIAVVKK